MIFVRVSTGEPKNGVYEFLDHGFKTEAEALTFKAMAEEDGTYWGMFNAHAAVLDVENAFWNGQKLKY